MEISPDRDELARQNIDLGMFQRIIQTALGGMKISESVQGRERYNIMLRYERPFREYPEDLSDILVPTPQGQHIPLGELASIEFVEGPPMIKSENARLSGWVFVDIADRDIGSYVDAAQSAVTEKVKLPPGYAIEWSGQFEQMLQAKAADANRHPVSHSHYFHTAHAAFRQAGPHVHGDAVPAIRPDRWILGRLIWPDTISPLRWGSDSSHWAESPLKSR